MQGVVLVLVVAVVLGGFVWLRLHQADRRRALRAEAAVQAGLGYAPKDPFGLAGWSDFELLARLHGRAVGAVVFGRRNDRDVRGFMVRAGAAGPEPLVCALLGVPADLPHCSIAAPEVFERDPAVPDDALDFASPDFVAAWQVRSRDPGFASQLVDAEMMLHLLERGAGALVETAGGWVLFAVPGNGTVDVVRAIERAEAFLERVPPLVWKTYARPEADGTA